MISTPTGVVVGVIAGKRPSESKAEVVSKIFPNDLNSEGTVFGGVILALMDRTALVVAERHSGKSCATVSIDAVRFLAPGRKGDNLICTAVITRSWTSSMEIDLQMWAEHPFSGETKQICEAFFTFCAFDQWGKPTKTSVPNVLPCTKEEHHLYDEAGIRMKERLAASKRRKERKASFLEVLLQGNDNKSGQQQQQQQRQRSGNNTNAMIQSKL